MQLTNSTTPLALDLHDSRVPWLRIPLIVVLSLLVGAICAYSPLDALAIALFVGLLWLAFERPASAFRSSSSLGWRFPLLGPPASMVILCPLQRSEPWCSSSPESYAGAGFA